MIKVGKILTYLDLKKIRRGENHEPLVVLSDVAPGINCRYQKQDMVKYAGQNILVRQGLARRLKRANQNLKGCWPTARLKVVYGYRHPEIQKKYFCRIVKKLQAEQPGLSLTRLWSKAHNFVAVPEVAGHVSGAAVDVTIESEGREWDMGSRIADYRDPEKVKTFSSRLNKEQKFNRLLLHDLLKQVGLAPFYGEWWHFSYGDQEWACFYERKKSLYSETIIKSRKKVV